MRKFIKKIHKWLGLAFGVIIFIVCFSGALLVFQDEIQEIANHERYFTKPDNRQPIALNELIQIVNEQLPDNKVKDVKISSDSTRTYAMGLAKGFRVTAYVDQYTGKIREVYSYRDSSFFFIMKLHRWFLDDSRTWGKYVVGISTLVFAIILITGVIIWYPKTKKPTKRNFIIDTKSGTKRLIRDLHSVLGLYAFIILFIGSATGLMWSFEWYRNGVFKIFGAEVEANTNKKDNKSANNTKDFNLDYFIWQKVVENITLQNPDFNYVKIKEGSVDVQAGISSYSKEYDNYKYDQSGEISDILLYKNQDKVSKIWAWTHALHLGDFWGIWSKILTFIAGLIGAMLPVTGYYLWWLKRKAKKVKKAA
ncbi:hypothetical protein MASR2M117_16040 [Paludibacter sp.]